MGKKVIYLPTCHSTNDLAADLLKKGGVNEGTIVITDNQTNGKGQRGNSWESDEGKNLTFSLIIHPTFLTAAEQFNLNIIVSLGIHNYLVTLDPSFKIKWPNDIYHHDKKIGGILIQNTIKNHRIENCIIGIGLNINQLNFSIPSASSLQLITNKQFDKSVVLESICHGIESEYIKLKSGKVNGLKSRYLDNLLGFSQERLFKAGQEFRGQICGISSVGKLQIQTLMGVREFDFKEVEFL